MKRVAATHVLSVAASRLRRGRSLIMLLVAITLAFAAVPASAQSGPTQPPAGNGLVRGNSATCAGAYQISGTKLCTHGPDPVPPELRERGRPQPVPESFAASLTTLSECSDDGQSGKRVQGLYVYVSGRENRRSTYLSSFRAWAANVDTMFRASAAESGGQRRVRWVTNAQCELAIPAVAVTSLAETNFATMISELTLLGYAQDDRKYLIWFDSDPHNSPYCGIGTVYVDDRKQGNTNDDIVGYARADAACWNWSEPHELMHTLGSVQPSAPHASGGLHCTDEYDQMCYQDGTGVVMTYPCPGRAEIFDCGHDDYFGVSPEPDSYLATHWNTADSSWLITDPPDTIAPVVDPPDASFVAGRTLSTTARVRLSWAEADDASGIETYELQRKKGSGSWTHVSLASPTATTVELDLTVGAVYSFRLRARDYAGNTGGWARTPRATLARFQEKAAGTAYAGSFKRVSLSGASGGYVRKSATANSVATFSFTGYDAALVSTLGPNRGIATVRFDGGSPQVLDLYNATLRTRHIVWSTSSVSGPHTVEITVSGSANQSAKGARVDVDAFLVWKPAT